MLLGGLTLAWGLNWPITKVVLSEMTPLHSRAVCLALGALGLFALALSLRLSLRVPKGQCGRLVLSALFVTTGWNLFAIFGIGMMPSGRAAILGYTMPLWAVILGAFVLKERVTRRRATGLVLGLAGVVLLFARELTSLSTAPLGVLLMLAAAFSWAAGTIVMKRWPVDMPASSYAAWQMLIGSVPLALGAMAFEADGPSLFQLSLWPLLGVFYSVTIAFVFGQWAWTRIALAVPAGVSSIAMLMTPVVGVFSGMLALGEELVVHDVAALCLVAASVGTVLIPARARTAPEPA
jgi:drug/metabolite transporter (DMT)-like permease